MGVTFPVVVAIRAIDRVTAPLNRINAAVAKARQPWVALGGALDRFHKAAGLDKLQDALGGVSSAFGRLGGDLVAFAKRAAFVLGGVAVGVFVLVRSFASAAEKLQQTSDKLGLNVETLQEWRYAAGLADVSAEDFDKSLALLERQMELTRRGNRATATSFERLGIKVTGPDGRLRNLAEFLPELADRLAAVDDPMRRVALAQGLFGKGGAKLIPILLQGSAGLRDMAAEARKLGVVLTTGAVAQAAAMDDDFDRLTMALKGVRNALAAAFAPAVQVVVKKLTAWLVDNREKLAAWAKWIADKVPEALDRFVGWIERTWRALEPLRAMFAKLIDVVGPLGVAIGVLAGILVVSLGPAIAGVISSLVTLSGVLLSTPAGWVVLAIAAVVAALAALAGAVIYVAFHWDALSARFPAAARLVKLLADVYLRFLAIQLETIAALFDAVATSVLFVVDAIARLVETFSGPLDRQLDKTGDRLDRIKDAMAMGLSTAVLGPLPALIRMLRGGSSSAPTFDPMLGPSGIDKRLQSLGALPAAAPAAPPANATVTVDFKNLPRGIKVTPEKASGVDVQVGLGWANPAGL